MTLLLLLLVAPVIAFAAGYQLGRFKATDDAVRLLQKTFHKGIL